MGDKLIKSEQKNRIRGVLIISKAAVKGRRSRHESADFILFNEWACMSCRIDSHPRLQSLAYTATVER